MKDKIIAKQEEINSLKDSIINWLEIRLNDLDSYAFYVSAKERLTRFESELSSLKAEAEKEVTDEEIDNWSLGRADNLAQQSLFDRGYLTGLKHGAIAHRDNLIKKVK